MNSMFVLNRSSARSFPLVVLFGTLATAFGVFLPSSTSAQIDMTRGDAAREPARLFIRHDGGEEHDVSITAGFLSDTCRTPCEVSVPSGRVTIQARRARRELDVGSGRAYDVEVDLGWDDEGFRIWVGGLVSLIAGGVNIFAIPAIGRAVGECTAFPLLPFIDCDRGREVNVHYLIATMGAAVVALYGAIVLLIGDADHVHGDVRLRPYEERQRELDRRRRRTEWRLVPSLAATPGSGPEGALSVLGTF